MSSLLLVVFPGQESPAAPKPNSDVSICLQCRHRETGREGERAAHDRGESTSEENQERQHNGQTGGQMVDNRHGFHEALRRANTQAL